MQIVDTAFREAAADGKPVRVAIIGAGWSARRLVYQFHKFVPGVNVVGVANRTLRSAEDAASAAGIAEYRRADSQALVDKFTRAGACVITDDAELLCASPLVDVVVESTGSVDYAAHVAVAAISNGKHVVALNAELDATLGPILAHRARSAGVVFSNSDGDEPGVAMNLIRTVRSLGLRPVVAGNLKGFYDRYRNPDSQAAIAAQLGQKPGSMTHFADGTKLSMELTVLGNALGWGVLKRGMHGPSLGHVNDAAAYFETELASFPETSGFVDFLLGASPGTGAFVVGHSDDDMHKDYLAYLKLGDGPYYVFYTPFHLPQLEVANTVGRAFFFGDAAVSASAHPTCETIAVAKQDLPAGTRLDGIGGFHTYGLIDNYRTAREQHLLPMGLAKDRVLARPVRVDTPITERDVLQVNEHSLAQRLRLEQDDLYLSAPGEIGG